MLFFSVSLKQFSHVLIKKRLLKDKREAELLTKKKSLTQAFVHQLA